MNNQTDACGHDYGLPPEERAMPDADLDAGTCRRLAASWEGLAASCEAAAGDDIQNRAIAAHHRARSAEYLERARAIERRAARKEQTNVYLSVIGMKLL